MNCKTSRRTALKSDSGVSLIEVAVAMIVLGIVLVGLFPLVIDSIRLAAQNATVAQANRVVSAQLDTARGALIDTDCGQNVATVVKGFIVTQTVSVCPAPQRLATVNVSVALESEPGRELSSAKTKVIVRMVEATP